MVDGVKGQFQPIRSSHFVEDPKQIVADGVFTQIELMGNITIGETSGCAHCRPLLLTFRCIWITGHVSTRPEPSARYSARLAARDFHAKGRTIQSDVWELMARRVTCIVPTSPWFQASTPLRSQEASRGKSVFQYLFPSLVLTP